MAGEVRYAGVDVGSTTTKTVVIDGAGTILGSHVMPSGIDLTAAAHETLREAIAEAGGEVPDRVVATGYGRENVAGANETVTEITCHGRGAYHEFPEAITIVDIGGQDTKVINLDGTGQRVGFKMNRKCSAGTGVFLDEIARRLAIPIEELDSVARESTYATPLNSYCTVFASTEMLARIRAGDPLADLVRGAYVSVVRRVIEMADLSGTVVVTGGVVTYHPIVAGLMGEMTGSDIKVPKAPQMVGALGAALIARDHKGRT